MKEPNYKLTKLACYFTYIAMAPVFSLPPILFATFKDMYGISYTLLGTLVVVNFCTQLGIDLIFSFWGKYFNIHRTIRVMPLFTSCGMLVFSLVPLFFPQYAYAAFVVGTFIFSIAAGLGEVLVSPTIAAIPSDNPDRDMSALHSIYGYGVVGTVALSTLYLKFVGNTTWMYLMLLWSVLPIISAVFLKIVPLPDMEFGHDGEGSKQFKHQGKTIALCFMCIFLGSCTENTMCTWVSVYMENALKMPKVWGDILGMCMFAGLLAITRTAYAKYGRNILKTLQISMLVSIFLYIIAGLSKNAVSSLLACALLGVSSAMLWPGTLILMEEKLPGIGVAAYALMAAGGDLGASVCPQLVGIIIDKVSISQWASDFGNAVALAPEQIGFKTAMIMTAVFPILGLLLLSYMRKFFKKNSM
ncbi:MAG: MFS transporter [Ruminococcaceae bacterium]|nr:MFS transporter [Oscillospiraceae bacterium]